MALTCLLTIHGIGFQQPPAEGVPGYADGLHERLRERLGSTLGDDPNRERGPVYVGSTWPPESRAVEPGLARPGTLVTTGGVWRTEGGAAWQRLAANDDGVAHVALIYSHLEEDGPDPAALVDLAALGLSSITHYATVSGIVRTAVRDIGALLHHHHPPADTPAPPESSLRGRSDLGVIHQVEDDVAGYVARNELRERLRAFVRDALTRLLLRDDVGAVVVNGHSKRTVVAFDVLAQLPPPLYPRVGALVTAGSPLRKYVELLGWGTDAANLRGLHGPWLNFLDVADPVADPLAPPAAWRIGQKPPADAPGLFVSYDPDTGERRPIPVRDIVVDNVGSVADGGGLPAHDYWDNAEQFCRPLAELLATVASGTAHP